MVLQGSGLLCHVKGVCSPVKERCYKQVLRASLVLLIFCITEQNKLRSALLTQPGAVRVSRGAQTVAQELMHSMASSLLWPWSGLQECVFFGWNTQKEEINLGLGIDSISFGISELTSAINMKTSEKIVF